MEAFNIALTEPFSFTQLENSPQWIQHFNQFCQLSVLVENLTPTNLTYLYISNQSEDILQSTDKEAKKYTMVLEKFKQYFVKCRNVIYANSKFNQNVQESQETVNAFITALCWLVEIYKYGQLKLIKWLGSKSLVRIYDSVVAEVWQLNYELRPEKLSGN